MRKARDFRRALASGRRYRCPGFVLVRAPGRPGVARVGLVTGRSIGGAAVRNRARRRLRHALAEVALEPGMDYVIIANHQVVKAPFATLRGWLADAFDMSRG